MRDLSLTRSSRRQLLFTIAGVLIVAGIALGAVYLNAQVRATYAAAAEEAEVAHAQELSAGTHELLVNARNSAERQLGLAEVVLEKTRERAGQEVLDAIERSSAALRAQLQTDEPDAITKATAGLTTAIQRALSSTDFTVVVESATGRSPSTGRSPVAGAMDPPPQTGLVYGTPYSGTASVTTGYDCAAPALTGAVFSKSGKPFDVLAVNSGTVIEVHAAVDSFWGKYVVVSHLDGIESAYAHLASISVSVGQVVFQGQKLGVAGSTGDGSCGTLGVGLHLAMAKTWTGFDGWLIDPEAFLRSHGVIGW